MYEKTNVNSPYLTGENGVDAFGVDHSDFSLRDELEYQAKMRNAEISTALYPRQHEFENWEGKYETESAWGYPHISSTPQYRQFDCPYSSCVNHTGYPFGSLSAEFESNSNPAAIGYDETGGYSYGLYQIATKPGTMKEYLNFLNNNDYKQYYQILRDSGGEQGATNGTSEFKDAWKKLAEEPEFSTAQNDFINHNRYKKIISKISDIKGMNLSCRHPVITDVIRSMAVQHGRADIPIHNALGHNSDISCWNDEDIINAMYKARINYIQNNSNLDEITKQNLINKRYSKERDKALNAVRMYNKGL